METTHWNGVLLLIREFRKPFHPYSYNRHVVEDAVEIQVLTDSDQEVKYEKIIRMK
jgi:hypothetical protein